MLYITVHTLDNYVHIVYLSSCIKTDYFFLKQVGIWMGIGWIFGFIASAVDMEILWWIFIVFNSLQGPLLLASILFSTRFQQLSKGTNDKGVRNRRQENQTAESKNTHVSKHPCNDSGEKDIWGGDDDVRRRSIQLKCLEEFDGEEEKNSSMKQK